MDKYNALDLKKKDLVLLETCLIRYRQPDDNGRYTLHRAQFELQTISILENAPEMDSVIAHDSDVDITDLEI